MVDPERRIRGRLPEELLVHHERWGMTLTENRRSSWVKLRTVVIVCTLLTGVLMVWQRNEPEMFVTLAVICGILFGIPLGIAALFVFPWNRRIVLDTYAGSCSAQKRFYTIPYTSRHCSLWHGSLEIAQVVHARYDTVQMPRQESSGMGCFMVLLGPIGTFVAGLKLLSSIKRIEQTAWALVYRENGGDQKTRVLITCRTDVPLHEVEAAYRAWLDQMGR